MNCPKCKTVEIHKSEFNSPLNCSKCGGMWIEKEQIPLFVESTSNVESENEGKSLNDDKTGLCPSGHGIMIRARIEIDGSEPFYLEKCTACGGIWFDNGEWQKIRNNNLTENLSEFWCKSWQIQQRKAKSRENYLESNRKLLGDSVFQEIMKLSELLQEHPEKGRAVALLQQELIKNYH